MLLFFLGSLALLIISYYILVGFDMTCELGPRRARNIFRSFFGLRSSNKSNRMIASECDVNRQCSSSSLCTDGNWRHSSPQLVSEETMTNVDMFCHKNRSLHRSSEFRSQAEHPAHSSLSSLVEDLKSKLSLEGTITKFIPTREATVFPVLPQQAINLCDRVWFCNGDPDEVLSKAFNINITRRDLTTLKPGNWLNDEVINFYFSLIADRSQKRLDLPNVYAFNTFFFPTLCRRGYQGVKRWTKSVNIFSYDIMLFPIHLGCHWCLAVYDNKTNTLRFLDSMHSNGFRHVDVIQKYLNAESETRFASCYPMNDIIIIEKEDVPRQMNGIDCGVFTCRFAEYASRRASIKFGQRDMPEFRRRILFEIVQQQLL